MKIHYTINNRSKLTTNVVGMNGIKKEREKKTWPKTCNLVHRALFTGFGGGARGKRPGNEVERHADSPELPRILLFLFPAISHFLKLVVHLRSQLSLDLYTLLFQLRVVLTAHAFQLVLILLNQASLLCLPFITSCLFLL